MAYQCWDCGRISFHPMDDHEGFCDACGRWAVDRNNLAEPRFWMAEQGRVLRPAMEALMRGDALTDSQISVIRAYLRQWIYAGVWRGPSIGTLRKTIVALDDRESIMAWLVLAATAGADPIAPPEETK